MMNHIRMRTAVTSALLIALILIGSSIPVTGYPYKPSETTVANALNYLRSVQAEDGGIGDFANSAWAVMAIAAAGDDPHKWNRTNSSPSIVDYLKNNAGKLDLNKATDVERFILAITAAGEDPRNINGMNYLRILEGLWDGTKIGDPSLLNDDFWGLIALKSGGSKNSTVLASVAAFIKVHQNPDGGWGYAVGVGSDVDDTAAAVMALTAAGEPRDSEYVAKGLGYIKSKQMDNGGFESFGGTNVGTDAWAICAIVSAGQDPTSESWAKNGKTPVDDLLTFRNADGSFSWPGGMMKELATSYALVALVGRYYPVNGLTVHVRIEGSVDTIWSGYVFAAASYIKDFNSGGFHYLPYPTPLGALDEASKMGGFSYLVNITNWGLYVWSIDKENASGPSGWMFRVDYFMPWFGADSFVLGMSSPPDPPHEEVLWYYGIWTDKPTRLTVDKLEVGSGEPFSVQVDWYNDSGGRWLPLEGAIVHVNGENYTTESDGGVSITKTVTSDRTYIIYAEKKGYIRSNRVEVKVSASPAGWSSGNVTVKANITAAIAIIIVSPSPPEIDFGTLGPGDVSEVRTIVVTNEGSMRAYVTVEVTRDDNGLFAKGLRFNGYTQRQFEAYVDGHGGWRAVRVRLWVPEDVAVVGRATGTVTFWAEKA